MGHSRGGMSASGYLNVVVDCMHNFTDGIAIGAAFTTTAKATAGTVTGKSRVIIGSVTLLNMGCLGILA